MNGANNDDLVAKYQRLGQEYQKVCTRSRFICFKSKFIIIHELNLFFHNVAVAQKSIKQALFSWMLIHNILYQM